MLQRNSAILKFATCLGQSTRQEWIIFIPESLLWMRSITDTHKMLYMIWTTCWQFATPSVNRHPIVYFIFIYTVPSKHSWTTLKYFPTLFKTMLLLNVRCERYGSRSSPTKCGAWSLIHIVWFQTHFLLETCYFPCN